MNTSRLINIPLDQIPVAQVVTNITDTSNIPFAQPIYQPYIPVISIDELENLLNLMAEKNRKVFNENYDNLAISWLPLYKLIHAQWETMWLRLNHNVTALEKEIRKLMHASHNDTPEMRQFYKNVITTVTNSLDSYPSDANSEAIVRLAHEKNRDLPFKESRIIKGLLYGISAIIVGMFAVGFLAATLFLGQIPKLTFGLLDIIIFGSLNLGLGFGTLALAKKSVGFFAPQHQSPVKTLNHIAENLQVINDFNRRYP